jgi:hypothetical protein
MIQLHVTKKLLAKLPIDHQGLLPVQTANQGCFRDSQASTLAANPLSGWHANLLLMQRRQCIILIHDTTRFAVFIPCLTKPDFANLNNLFIDCFINSLLKCGANQVQLETTQQLMAPLQIDSVCNRSVQGTMNRMAGDIENFLHYDQVDVSQITGNRIGAWLAARPCNIKGQKDYVIPVEPMLGLLDESVLMLSGEQVATGGTVNEKDSIELPSNVISMKDFQRS